MRVGTASAGAGLGGSGEASTAYPVLHTKISTRRISSMIGPAGGRLSLGDIGRVEPVAVIHLVVMAASRTCTATAVLGSSSSCWAFIRKQFSIFRRCISFNGMDNDGVTRFTIIGDVMCLFGSGGTSMVACRCNRACQYCRGAPARPRRHSVKILMAVCRMAATLN